MVFKRNSAVLKIILSIFVIFLLGRFFSGCSDSKNSLEVVKTVKATRDDLVVTISSTGEVKPQNRIEIKPGIAGRVDEVLVKEGEQVKRGQTLAWMSSTERAALIDVARSQGPEAIKKWEDAYKPAPLIAPLDGTVIVRAVEPGQTVTTADPVIVLSDRLIINALVDETDLSLIALGQASEIRLDAYPNRTIKAKVDHISYESTLVNNVNVYAVDVLPEEVPATFRSGMTANVTFLISDRKDVTLVPSEAIVSWPKNVKNSANPEFAVYKKSFGGKLTPIAVKIGETDGRMTEIVEGIKPGEEVAVVKKRKKESGSNPFSPQGARSNRSR